MGQTGHTDGIPMNSISAISALGFIGLSLVASTPSIASLNKAVIYNGQTRNLDRKILNKFSIETDVKVSQTGFGSAESTNWSTGQIKYDAWCASRGNDCVIEFTDNAIVIDSSSSVPYNQLKSYSYREQASDCSPGQVFFCKKSEYKFLIEYQKDDGNTGAGTVLFGNTEVAVNFMSMLKRVANRKPLSDPRCRELDQVMYKGVCMDQGVATRRRANDVKQSRQDMADSLQPILKDLQKNQERIDRQYERDMDRIDRNTERIRDSNRTVRCDTDPDYFGGSTTTCRESPF